LGTNEKWGERYRRGEASPSEPAPLLVRFASTLPPGRALDLACGSGRNAIYLARQGWEVTAVDASAVAIDMLEQRTAALDLHIDSRTADLEKGEFTIERAHYDLICNFYYLQRGLFAPIRSGVVCGGLVIATIHTLDDDPEAKPMNPDFLLHPGELLHEFRGWEILRYREGKPQETEHRRAVAELVARKRNSPDS
jgi:tellurite methyltransferase